MRTMKVALLVTTLVVCASAAHAADMTFGLNGDGGLPIGDFGTVPSTTSTSDKIQAGMGFGFGGGAYGDYWVKKDYAFGLDVDGQFFSAKSDTKKALNTALSTTDAKFTTNVINVCAHGVWAPTMASSSVQPWVTYGAGWYRVAGKIDAGGKSVSGNANKFGFNAGVGGDMKAGAAMKVGLHVRYHYVLDGLDPKIVDLGGTSAKKSALSFLTFGVNLTFMTNGAK